MDPLRRFRPWIVHLGGGVMAPIERWEWKCPACGWFYRSEEKTDSEARARLHRCQSGSGGDVRWLMAGRRRFRHK